VLATSHCCHIFNYYHHKLQSRASPPVELSITRLPLLSSYHLLASRACVLRATAVIFLLVTIIKSHRREPTPVEPSHLYALACHIIITSVRATSHCRHIFNYYHHKLQSRASPLLSRATFTRYLAVILSSRACVLRATAVIYLITIITTYSREPPPPLSCPSRAYYCCHLIIYYHRERACYEPLLLYIY
jgi:hypothetical protein